MTNLYTIKARLAELREELMNHAAAWSDVPGGADNPIAQAEYARIWKISIHAPRAGGDCRRYTTVWRMGRKARPSARCAR